MKKPVHKSCQPSILSRWYTFPGNSKMNGGSECGWSPKFWIRVLSHTPLKMNGWFTSKSPNWKGRINSYPPPLLGSILIFLGEGKSSLKYVPREVTIITHLFNHLINYMIWKYEHQKSATRWILPSNCNYSISLPIKPQLHRTDRCVCLRNL